MIKWIKLIKNIKNLKIKYKLHSSFNNYYKSSLIENLLTFLHLVGNNPAICPGYYIKYGEVNNSFKKYIILIMIYHIMYIIINL